MKGRGLKILAALLTVLSVIAIARGLRLSPDVSALLPQAGDGAALRQYSRAFGGGDLGMLLIRGQDPERVLAATHAASRSLAGCDRVRAAHDGFAPPGVADPTLAWTLASPEAMRRLREVLTPEGMRERLAETRSLLLGPGAGALAETIRRDPLRLSQIPFEGGVHLAEGARAEEGGALGAGGALVADEGRARVILIAASGDALRGAEARAFVDGVEGSLGAVRAEYSDVRFELTGGHAIAAGSEAMIRRDLAVSGTASIVLAAIAFALTFRRLRALLAVLPPLLLGTAWTAAIAATLFDSVSAIAVAFVSVVVGVGVDTGVHVYAALLEARAAGMGPREAAAHAQREMARPTLTAAIAAAAAFGSLALSNIEALRQFGLLCAAGELLTAVAILVLTPGIGEWLERGPVAARQHMPGTASIERLWSSRTGLVIAALAVVAPIVVIAWRGLPSAASAVVAVRPTELAAIRTQDEIFDLFGGTRGQWIVMVPDADPDRARARADAIADRLASSPDLSGPVSTLAWMAPSIATQQRRLGERDALDLPQKAKDLLAALQGAGFAPDRFEPAIESFRRPTVQLRDGLEAAGASGALWKARFLGRYGDQAVAALYLVPRPGRELALQESIAQVDAGAKLAGYARLDHALRESLAADLPRIGLVAVGLVAVAIAVSLRRLRDVAIALLAIAVEIAWVLAVVQLAGLRLHAYNALVIPVLVGITVDEAMFLLTRARREGVSGALRGELRNVTATAMTTAAGFGALIACRFDGLSDLGWVGALGSIAGLIAALVVVPAGLRVWRTQPGLRLAP